MQITAKRTAFFPGERVRLEAVADDPDGVRWSVDGVPASGSGPRFRARFTEGATYSIEARSNGEVARVEITVCPVDEWLRKARDFFGPSLDLDRVRITTSPWVIGPPGTGWTCNTIVRFKRPTRAADLPAEVTLMHELAHVWEHRAGQAQLLTGFLEQLRRRFGHDPYDFGGPAGLRDAKALTRFSKESQAQILGTRRIGRMSRSRRRAMSRTCVAWFGARVSARPIPSGARWRVCSIRGSPRS
jgi:hypothetical protein